MRPTHRLRLRQTLLVAAHELRRSLLHRRAVPLLLFASLPVLMALLRALFLPEPQRTTPGPTTAELANVFAFFHLRFVVFFATAIIFVKAYRGEVLERSLHYALLSPLRRETLTVGKYLGSLACTFLVLGSATVAMIVAFYVPVRGGLGYVLTGAGAGHALGYLVVVALACAGYGGLFLLFGLVFRNPIVVAVVFLGWELLVPFLPPALKMFSVVHYLGALLPVPVSVGTFELMADPVPAPTAVLALLVIAALLVTVSAVSSRRLQVTYGTD